MFCFFLGSIKIEDNYAVCQRRPDHIQGNFCVLLRIKFQTCVMLSPLANYLQFPV